MSAAEIVSIPQKCPVYRVAYCALPNKKRRAWRVQCIYPSGEIVIIENISASSEQEAEWFANLLRERDAKNRDIDRLIENNPFFKLLSELSPEMIRAALYVLNRAENKVCA